jgi:hypothetical protein
MTIKQNYGARGLIVTPPSPPSPGKVAAADALAEAAKINPASDDYSAQARKKALTAYSEILQQKYSTTSWGVLKEALPGIQAEAVNEAISSLQIPSTAPPNTPDVIKVDAQKELQNQALPQSSTAFQRPKDVSCSMSVLSWDEAHKAFGRTVADTFLAVQIVVRNLDANNEFLIHDAELAVDANSAQLSRFQVSHEKELTRGVLVYGQSYDRQHVFVNIVDGFGTILGAVVAIPQPALVWLTGMTGAYHAGLLPVLHNLFPDLTTKNLNTLNDLAFSAASSSRIVVPKSGSVPFVMFVPIKPLEQACWLQPGYDLYKETNSPAPWTSACSQVCTNTDCTNENLKTFAYKKWTPFQVQALEWHAYALMAGVHIKEVGQPAVLNSIVCAAPTDISGAYLQYKIPGDTLTCALTGTDLDTMTTLRFRSPNDAKTNIDAKVNVVGDNTTATAVLAPADVARIQQSSYELYAVDKSGNEHDLNRTVKFRLPPSITSGQTVPETGTATLKGANLGGTSQIVFYDSTGATKITTADVSADATGNSITFAAPANAALPTGKNYAIHLILNDGSNTDYTLKDSKGTVITVSKGSPAPAPSGSVKVTPNAADVALGVTQKFTADPTTVDWSVSCSAKGDKACGEIDSKTGVYTAPATLPSPNGVTVTAKSTAGDTSTPGTATVTITSLSPDPASLEFGTVDRNSSLQKSVSFTNKSAASVTVVGPLAADGTNKTDFRLVDGSPSCLKAIASGNNCKIAITFTPKAGSDTTEKATVNLKNSSGNVLGSVALTGTVK